MGSQQNTSSNQTSQNSLNFNPGAENIYNSLTGSGSNVLQQYMNNPLSNPMYQLGQSQSQGAASQLGANAMGVLGQNQKTSGLTGQAGAGWLQAQKAQTGRANQSMNSQANLSNIMGAFNRQMGATGQAMSFSPQITGSQGSGTSNSQTTTGGLGTWLPQLLGSLGGAAMGGGGLSGLMSSFGGGGSSGAYQVPSSMGQSFPGFNPGGPPTGAGGMGTVPGMAPSAFPPGIFG